MEKEEISNKHIDNKVVKTYVADMASVVDGKEGIYIKKIIEEEEKNKEEESLSISNIKNKIFTLIGLFLIFAAVGAVGYLEFSRKKIFTVNVEQELAPLIYLDSFTTKEVDDFSKEQIFQSILNRIFLTEVKDGGVLGVYLTINKKVLGFRKFLETISANVDQSKIEFISDNFLIGSVNLEKKDNFILLKMRSFSDIFDAMHSWEDKIFYDLHGFFGIDISFVNNYLVTKNFEDGIVQNRNARILRDNDGKVVMMYVFIDDTSLLITDSATAAREIALRLSSGVLKK